MRQFFTEANDRLSMMRGLSAWLVISGTIIVVLCVLLEKDGGHYGVELAVLGIIGKGYQKKIEEK
jgi:hypothetical protein